MQAISRIDSGCSRLARFLVPALVVTAFLLVAAGCGSTKSNTPVSTAVPTSTTAPGTTTVAKKAAPKPIQKIPASAAPRAKAYIAAHEADIKKVIAYESAVQVATAEVQNSPDYNDLQQTTQVQYNKLSKLLPRFKGPFTADALGYWERQISVQANSLEKSMKALLNYTAFPTPATLTEYTDAYQSAILGWNKAIKTIWAAANVPSPPKICTTC